MYTSFPSQLRMGKNIFDNLMIFYISKLVKISLDVAVRL